MNKDKGNIEKNILAVSSDMTQKETKSISGAQLRCQ